VVSSISAPFGSRGCASRENSTRSICAASVTVATVERELPPSRCWSTMIAAEMLSSASASGCP
jgi:hypothetical protein